MSKVANGVNTSKRLLISAAALVAFSSFLSRLLGLVRDRLFASRFGAGAELDAYFAAYRVPDLMFNLLVLGTLSAAFLPVFTSYLSKDREGNKEAFEVAHSLLTLAIMVLSLTALVLFFLAPWIVPVLAPGFSGNRLALTVDLTRIMLLQPILLGASSILSGVLTSFGRFLAYATAPVVYNLGIIIGVIFFVPFLGVAGLAWGVVLGALLHFLVQVPAALRVGFRFKPRWSWKHEGLKKIGRLMLPRLVGLAASQANMLVVTFFGSLLATGSIAVFIFADNLQAVPIGIVGISFAVAAFPQLSHSAAKNASGEFLSTLISSIKMILFLIVPFSVAMLLLRAQIVRVILGTGRFDWQDTFLTLEVLGILVVSVFAQSLIPLLARAFFAMQDTRTPMYASVAAILTNVGGAFFFIRLFSEEEKVLGLAVAFTVASILHFLILLTSLHARLGGLQDRELFGALLKICGASLLAGLVIQYLKTPLASAVDMQRLWGVLAQLCGAAAGGFAVYLLVAYFTGLKELQFLKSWSKSLLTKR